MKKSALFISIGVLLGATGCSTLNESFQLGAVTGGLSGAGAAYAGHKAAGGEPTLKNVAAGAGIGLAVGLVASYFIHRSVEEDRMRNVPEGPEVQFGDLPPNPFFVEGSKAKGGR